MVRTCYLHLGMPKTGSKSIQSTLAGYKDDRITYAGFKHFTHSIHLSVLFSDRPEVHTFPELQRKSPAKLEIFKKTCRLIFQDDLDRKTDLILSAEGIGLRFTNDELTAMRTKLLRHFDRIRILNYIRPVKSLAASDFQQHIKGGLNNFHLPLSKYRKRTESWINVFGRENCDFRLYDRKSLIKGDVIDDFLEYVNINSKTIKKNVANESMSLEATALLFAHNVFGGTFFNRFNKDELRTWILPSLRTFGEKKFGFSDLILQNYAENQYKDIEWMSNIAGFDLIGTAPAVDEPITGPDHLLSVAYQSLPKAREAMQRWKDDEEKPVNRFQKKPIKNMANGNSQIGLAKIIFRRLFRMKKSS